MNAVRMLVAILAVSAVSPLATDATGTKSVTVERGYSPEVAGLRGRLHDLRREADGTCYTKYTLYAGKDFRGRRGMIYAVVLRYFDMAGKPVESKDVGTNYLCGEENFSDWKGDLKTVIGFTPPHKAVFVSAMMCVDKADIVTEKVRIPMPK